MRLLIVAILLASTPAAAEPQRLAIEQDPLAYLFDGWDVMVAYQHPALPHLRALVSVFAVDWPQVADGFADRQRAITTVLQYYLREGGRGWWFGVQLDYGREDYTYAMTPGHQSLDIGIARAVVGYRWFPFGDGLFIYPWGGPGVSVPLAGDHHIDIAGHKTTPSYFSPVATLHVGYEFTF